MPLYDYKCPSCGLGFSRILRLAEYDRPQTCLCGAQAQKQLAAPAVRGDYAGYTCPVSGKWIEGRRAHTENLARTGCRVYEPGETESLKRRKAAEEAKLDREVEETADRFIAGLSADQTAKLANEVAAGATATVERL